MDTDNDLFSASLEAIETSKRADKFQRFFTEFQRDCDVTLNNAQEWIKAELPIVANYIDLAPLKEELKSNKTSTRRKHLLSALIFEQATRDAAHKHQAATAAIMAMHMLNHIWQAKLEFYETQPTTIKTSPTVRATGIKAREKSASEQEEDLKREQILTTLIKKGEQLKSESQIQQQNASAIQPKPIQKPTPQKNNAFSLSPKDLWKEATEKERLKMFAPSGKDKKPKRKTNGMFSKMRTKIPLKKKTRGGNTDNQQPSNASEQKPDDSLLDNPNNSAIMVSNGLFKDIDDSLIQARPRFSDDPNESGITVRKVLKSREQKTHEPGTRTVVMKLASSAGRRDSKDMSIPEQCQQAVNRFYQQFPGYDMVAIRNLAAQKVGVSPQYIENLNILPERIS